MEYEVSPIVDQAAESVASSRHRIPCALHPCAASIGRVFQHGLSASEGCNGMSVYHIYVRCAFNDYAVSIASSCTFLGPRYARVAGSAEISLRINRAEVSAVIE